MNIPTSPIFTGCATALVTPFLPDGALDEQALRRLVAMQLRGSVDALVLLGTTGEPSTLTMDERERIIQIGMEEIRGRIPLIVGTGSNNTRLAMQYAKQAKALGAQGQLCVTPYYNKTTQTGLLRHFGAILDCCELPMILYNVPGRTGMCISAQTAAELAVHPGVAGVKEASGNPALTADIMNKTGGELPIYSGNDDIIVPLMALGAKGAISVCSNVIPAQMSAMTKACLAGDFAQAGEAQKALLPLMHALFAQVNPIPAKAALAMMGVIGETLRLPLTPMDEPYRSELHSVLAQMQLIQ